MSISRQRFLDSLSAIAEAVNLDPLANGAAGPNDGRGLIILRRGMLITSLIALETFVRDRTAEILDEFAKWPATYSSLPSKLRDAALIDALSNLQKYAKMMKRQEDDYESLIVNEIKKMSMTSGPLYGFSRFAAGDFTGNLSDTSLKDLLSMFQVKDCWATFRSLSAEAGIGVPSVHEIVKDIVGKRHKSAHAADFVPTISDIRSVVLNLTCVGICFDASMTSSARYAMHDWEKWSTGDFEWRKQLTLYLVDPQKSQFRLRRYGAAKALRVLNDRASAPAAVPQPAPGSTILIVDRDEAERPTTWSFAA